jgi:hypothetical protein
LKPEFAKNFTSASSAARILDIAALGSQRRGTRRPWMMPN